MSTPIASSFKTHLFEQFAQIGKALGSGARLEIVEFLAQRERSVEELARLAGISIANASQHLKVLKTAGLVENRKEGLRVIYRLSAPEVFALWANLRDVAQKRLAGIDRLVRERVPERTTLEAVTLPELRRKMAAGQVVLLDVRPEEEFQSGHIRGARNIPLAALERHLRSLPKDAEIVAYCRGPYCVLSDDAVAMLRAKGRKAFRLEQGYPDWRALGWPCAVGPETTAGGVRA
jgi:rhodanese-related sulfurtransferase/DNA-binding MarR family transcriptional regulator